MKYFLYILLIFSFCYSCSSNKKERIIKLDEVVDYHEVLFGVEDSLLIITPDFNKSSSNIGIQLLDTLREDSLNQVKFNLDIGNGKLIPAYIESFKNKEYYHNSCEYCKNKFYLIGSFIRAISHTRDLNISIEEQSYIDIGMFNMLNELTLDSHHQHLTLDWSITDTTEENINSNITFLFESLEPAYYLFYERIALQRYSKPLHELEEKLLYDLKSEFPYRIKLCVILPIPPPKRTS